jgi:hypothetical protein
MNLREKLHRISRVSTKGGARPNSGRKSKYGEKTRVITIRVPISHEQAIKEKINLYLESLIK